MKITRILNNNVVVVLDEHKREQVVMGCGLAFKKRAGDILDTTKIEKIFFIKNNNLTTRLTELFNHIPLEVITACHQLIELAQARLGKLQDSLYITLADHCHYAIERQKKGLVIKNAILWEIKQLYPHEFQLGQEALTIFSRHPAIGVELAEDEAGFIALHLVTAQLHNQMPEVVQITQIMQELLHLVKYHLYLEYNENSLSYQRFVTHLKFFSQRILTKTTAQDDDQTLHKAVQENYPHSWKCAEKITAYLSQNYQRELTNQEKMFLTIHIEHVRRENREALENHQ